ncbi:glycosyltransferase family 2 protein [Sphingomonas sp.]|uniref:glycosyltransferase family 2 protein n=1 Tax=Sphingomonas sp. TaxID=28214 RepID=UPI0035C7A5C1
MSVSAVITAYRRADVVRYAIASALAQDHPVLEVIVVDDASGDDTVDAVLSVRDPRVRLVRLPENVGPSGAMNAGIAAARGRLVALLDSDDRWLPHKLSRQVAAWQAHPLRDRLLVASRVLDVADGQVVGVRPQAIIAAGEDVADYLFVRDGLLQTSTMLLPRALASRIGFDAATRRHSDPGFVLRLASAGACFLQLEEPLTCWCDVRGVARVSEAASLDQSLAWLRRYARWMSPRARVAFRYRNHIRILRRRAPLAAVWLTLRAALAGVLGRREVARAWRRVRG